MSDYPSTPARDRSLRDRLWLWCHPAGAYNGQYRLPGESQMSPRQGLAHLGINNAVMVRYAGKPAPPFDAVARELASLDRVGWSIVGDSSSIDNNVKTDLDEVLALTGQLPNLSAAVMDDFFHAVNPAGQFARWSVDDVKRFQDRLHAATPNPLDLWVVVYTHDLHLPLGEHLRYCDVLTLWTWKAGDLPDLERNLTRLENLAPGKRILVGVYLWDFGNGCPIPLDLLQRQCEQARQWIEEGRVQGMVFVASTICDLRLEAVQWLRRWIELL